MKLRDPLLDLQRAVEDPDHRPYLPLRQQMIVDHRPVLLVGPFEHHAAVLVDLADGRVARRIDVMRPGPLPAVASEDSDDPFLSWQNGTQADSDVLALSRDWRVEYTGEQTIVLRSQDEKVAVPGPRPTLAKLDPTGERLALVDTDGLVRVWHLSNPTEPRDITTPASAVHFGPNNLVATAQENEVVVWNSTTGHPLAELTADAPVTALAFTADGGRLATGTTAGTVEVWSLRAQHTDPDLTANALRITAEERTVIVALRPLISTPRLAKRLINTYRLLRASLTADELTRLRRGEHKVVLILLAVLLGEPERAHGLLRTLASDATLPTNFTTRVRRSARVGHTPRPTVARRRLAPAPDPFETTLARVIAETKAVDNTNSYQRWAPVVSRYSFRFVDP